MIKKKIVKDIAYSLGIDICGITDIKELKKEKDLLKKRKSRGSWPQVFTNQNIEELCSLKSHHKNLKSTIAAAVAYRGSHNDKGSISSYVTELDYHKILRNKMEFLMKELSFKLDLNLVENQNYKIFVDTAPFLEKAVAEKAGLGFIGKNSMLINPEMGSYLFIGEILTDLEIETDSPLKEDCGDCRICLDKCEGKALKEPYLLEGNSCISYLTQKKGIISKKERKKIY